MPSKFKDTDNGYNDLVKRLFAGDKPTVAVGIFEKEGAATTGDGTTIIEVATWQEFGTEEIPERSFLRAWFDENIDKAGEALRRLMVSVVQGKRTKEQALELFGAWLQGQIQARISAGISPPNAESTIAKKGSSTPLIDKGQLRSSITFKVAMNGTIEES